MDKQTCKLCFRRFSNGRALGGHMRSHAAGRAAAAVYSASSTSSAEEVEEKGSGLSYVLRENPRKSFRLVDPEFSSYSAAMDAGSSVVQDRESETESPPAPAFFCHRRRSKRLRRGPPPPPAEPETEPASSVSDTTLEEDVAISLMMLSRDAWTKSGEPEHQWEDEYHIKDEEVEFEQIAGGGSGRRNRPEAWLPSPPQQLRSKFQCDTCKKVFRSYQALGGHCASHKKMKQSCSAGQIQYASECADANADHGSKAHECPVCSRIFGSGQALGGHKRSHVCSTSAAASAAAAATITIVSSPSPPPLSPMRACSKYRDTLIDLNLPAPMDDDAAELSAVSDDRPFI